jgi:collagenase-like PrtC family protease
MKKAFANFMSAGTAAVHSSVPIDLICPATNLAQLRTAVDNGANCIQLQIPEHDHYANTGKNLNIRAMASGIRYARDRCCKVSVRITADATASSWMWWKETISQAAALGVHAIELSDPGWLLYATAHYPQLELHYAAAGTSVDANAIELYRRQFIISRVALPSFMSASQLIDISQGTSIGLHLNGFCRFSSAIDSTRLHAAAVEKHVIKPKLPEPKPDIHIALCATAENAVNDNCFSNQNQGDIKVLQLLPQLHALGVRAICVEAAASHPASLAQATRVWREAIDECIKNIDRYAVKPAWIAELNSAVCRSRNY